MAKTKKVNLKTQMKIQTVNTVKSHFESLGLKVSNGSKFGMTDSTLIVHFEECDIQIKVVAPGVKNGDRYTMIEE